METQITERVDRVGDRRIRTLVAGPPDADRHVVIVPGMGALGYLLPTVRAVADSGLRCTLLDVPGFGSSRPRPTSPVIGDIAQCVAAWLFALPDRGDRLVVVGHSTGAQSALRAAVQVQDGGRPAVGVVLAGPTVEPAQRSLPRILSVAPAAYRRDSPRELVVTPDYLRARWDAVRMLRSAIEDRPEETIAHLRGELVLTSGRADSFAPAGWLARLAAAAVRTSSVRAVQLPGSHNNPFTHPRLLAMLITSLASDG